MQVVFQPYIQDKNGNIYIYDKPRIKAANSSNLDQSIVNKAYNKSNIPSNSGAMEEVIAVNYRILDKILFIHRLVKKQIFLMILKRNFILNFQS